jgi:hypothetical protein
VATTVGRASPPIVIRGRQEAWIAGGQLFVLALESPEGNWPQAAATFDRLVAKVEI